VGCGGNASFTGKPTVVEDIHNDPKRTSCNALFVENREQDPDACWSLPTILLKGEVPKTFTNYNSQLGEPSDENMHMQSWSQQVTAMSNEKQQAEEYRQQSEELYKHISEEEPVGLFQYRMSA
jgi:hypothetical protein